MASNNLEIQEDAAQYLWSTKEVDFIISIDGNLIPIEVKNGEHVTSASQNEYMHLFNPAYDIRISEKNFGMENKIKSIPLFAAFCIQNDWTWIIHKLNSMGVLLFEWSFRYADSRLRRPPKT